MENENYSGPTGDSRRIADEDKIPPIATPDETVEMALTDDDTKVSFTNANSIPMTDQSRNGDAKVNIENVKIAFAGMGKDELMKFANDPFWIRTRWTLFILFWVAWLAMMIGAIVIIFLVPRCAPTAKLDWWQKNVIYQIYTRSFKDTNGDGNGDLAGIGSELDYLNGIGIKTIWLNPIYKSGDFDSGYDVVNYTSVDPMYGTIDDFELLVANLTSRDMKLILDFIPNHTSNKSEWFIKSREGDPHYKDYYIWAKGKSNGEPPTNWVSVFGGSAWTYDDVRGEYYFHQFSPQQPDLNLRSDNVTDDLEKVLRFWLDLGVSGFRVDAVSHLFESFSLTDEPKQEGITSASLEYDTLNHVYTFGQPENVVLVKKWRDFLDKYKNDNGGDHRLLVVESSDPFPDVMQYYGNSSDKVSDFPFNFQLLKLNSASDATEVRSLITSWFANLTDGSWPNWVLGNHDKKRIATRVDPQLVDGLNMISLLITGTPVTYYGEELGMTDNELITLDQTRDMFARKYGDKYLEYSRDPERTPMQWSDENEAGFTSGSNPWLPVNSNYKTGVNVKAQQEDKRSHLSIYKSLISLRKENSILYGSLAFLDINDTQIIDGDVLGFSRVKRGYPGYLVLVNFGATNGTIRLVDYPKVTATNFVSDKIVEDSSYKFPEKGNIELASSNVPPSSSLFAGENRVRLNAITLGPAQAIVINFVPDFV